MKVFSDMRLPGFSVTALFCMFFLYAPILVVIGFSFNSGALVTVWEDFSFKWYHKAFANPDLLRATLNSLIVACGTMVIAPLLALLTALALRERQGNTRGRAGASILLVLPMLVPEIVLAVATVSFFSMVGLKMGLGNVLIAHVVFCIPFAFSPIWLCLQNVPRPLSEAAADLYADSGTVFRKVTLPLIFPGILSGALLAFITSIDNFIVAQMVAPPGAMTLPLYIYSMVRKGATPEINAVSSLLLAVSISFVLAAHIIGRRKGYRG